MDILMVSAELGPYARETRAGDSVAALSKALAQMGHDVTIVLPRYPRFEESGLLVARRLTPLKLDDGQVTVFDGQLSNGVKIALLDAPEQFDREGLFGDGSAPYADNAARFDLFSRAAAALVHQRAEQGHAVDVVHAHDWAAAGAVARLTEMPARPALVVTIHEAPLVKGRHAGEAMMDLLCYGVRAADVVTTVSPSYAVDQEAGVAGDVLAHALTSRDERIAGVLGGLDYAVYNPATDAALQSRYDAEDSEARGSAKLDLLRTADLELSATRALAVVMVDDEQSRRLVTTALHDLLRQDVSVVLCGALAHRVRDETTVDPARFDGVCAFRDALDDKSFRRICAAADVLVTPRAYDADAFAARCAQRYGALPVAFAAGGVQDAVVDCDAGLETGTGFLFAEPTADALMGALTRSLAAFTSLRWPVLRRRVMKLDLGWDRPARRYAQLYRQAVVLAKK